MIESFEYRLKNPLRYALNGRGDNESDLLTVCAPNFKQRAYKRRLKQVLGRASQKAALEAVSLSKQIPRELFELLEMQKSAEAEARAKEILDTQEAEAQPEKPNEKQLLMALQSHTDDGKYSELIEDFERHLLGNNVCFLGEENEQVKMTQHLIEQIDPDELEVIFGLFLGNFINPSL